MGKGVVRQPRMRLTRTKSTHRRPCRRIRPALMRLARIVAATAGIVAAAVTGTLTTGCDYFGIGNQPPPGARPGHADASVHDAGSMNDGGPLISSAPPAWQPANCGGVGNLCAAGCTPAGECVTTQNVCVPMAGPSGFPGPSMKTPYCMALTCMTFEQASCFCSGPAGALFPECALGPAAVVGLCGSEGASCASRGCCGSLKCIKDSPTSGACYRTCSTNADCGGGNAACCVDLKGTGDRECAPLSACANPCTTQGGSCTDTRRCCTGTCVTGSTNVDFLGCRPSCTTNTDCLSGCCQRFSNSSGGFCVDARYCSCAAAGAECTYIACCAGSSCGSFQPDGGGPFHCTPNCMSSVDCDGGCCSANYPGKTYGGCAPKCN
jgi:hypothetical protein